MLEDPTITGINGRITTPVCLAFTTDLGDNIFQLTDEIRGGIEVSDQQGSLPSVCKFVWLFTFMHLGPSRLFVVKCWNSSNNCL